MNYGPGPYHVTWILSMHVMYLSLKHKCTDRRLWKWLPSHNFVGELFILPYSFRHIFYWIGPSCEAYSNSNSGRKSMKMYFISYIIEINHFIYWRTYLKCIPVVNVHEQCWLGRINSKSLECCMLHSYGISNKFVLCRQTKRTIYAILVGPHISSQTSVHLWIINRRIYRATASNRKTFQSLLR